MISRPLPFDRAYWARSGLLAGCYPGSPNPREAKAKAMELVRCGVSHCVNLMEIGELDHHGNPFLSYIPAITSAAVDKGRTVTFSRHAIRDCSIPTVEEMIAILDTIDEVISANGTVYVHCWGGRGRTGTVMNGVKLRPV